MTPTVTPTSDINWLQNAFDPAGSRRSLQFLFPPFARKWIDTGGEDLAYRGTAQTVEINGQAFLVYALPSGKIRVLESFGGNLAWEASEFGGVFGSPVLSRTGGLVKVIYATNDSRVIERDLATGTLLSETKRLSAPEQPLVLNGSTVLIQGRDAGEKYLAQPCLCGGEFVTADTRGTIFGSTWSVQKDSAAVGLVCAGGNLLYVLLENGRLELLDAANQGAFTGWQLDLGGTASHAPALVHEAPDRLAVGMDDGRLLYVERGAAGQAILWTSATGGSLAAPPVGLGNGTVAWVNRQGTVGTHSPAGVPTWQCAACVAGLDISGISVGAFSLLVQDSHGNVTSFFSTPLEIKKSVDRENLLVGETVVFTLEYGNQSAVESVTNVKIVDNLPAGMSLVNAAPYPVVDGNTMTWSLGTLPPGADGAIVFSAILNDFSAKSNAAVMSADNSIDVLSNAVSVQAFTPTLTPTKTATQTGTPTDSVTATFSISPTNTNTPFQTTTNTFTKTITYTRTITLSPTISPTPRCEQLTELFPRVSLAASIFTSVIVDSSSRIVVAGSSPLGGALWRYDPLGNLEAGWPKYISMNWINKVIELPTGELIVVGAQFVMKLDSAGTVLNTISGSSFLAGTEAVSVDLAAGGLELVVTIRDTNDGYYITRLSTNDLTRLSQYHFTFNNFGFASDAVVWGGHVYVAGAHKPASDMLAFTDKIDLATGLRVWQYDIPDKVNNINESGTSIKRMSDGRFAIGGSYKNEGLFNAQQQRVSFLIDNGPNASAAGDFRPSAGDVQGSWVADLVEDPQGNLWTAGGYISNAGLGLSKTNGMAERIDLAFNQTLNLYQDVRNGTNNSPNIAYAIALNAGGDVFVVGQDGSSPDSAAWLVGLQTEFCGGPLPTATHTPTISPSPSVSPSVTETVVLDTPSITQTFTWTPTLTLTATKTVTITATQTPIEFVEPECNESGLFFESPIPAHFVEGAFDTRAMAAAPAVGLLDDGLYLAGSEGFAQGVLQRLSVDFGIEQWDTPFFEIQTPFVKKYLAVVASFDGGAIVAGYSNGTLDLTVLKVSPEGQQVWKTTMTLPLGAEETGGIALAENPQSQQVYVVGNYFSETTGITEAIFRKLNSMDGAEDVSFRFSASEKNIRVIKTSGFNSLIVLGRDEFLGVPWLAKMNGSGAFDWEENYDVVGSFAQWNDMVLLDQGKIAVAGAGDDGVNFGGRVFVYQDHGTSAALVNESSLVGARAGFAQNIALDGQGYLWTNFGDQEDNTSVVFQRYEPSTLLVVDTEIHNRGPQFSGTGFNFNLDYWPSMFYASQQNFGAIGVLGKVDYKDCLPPPATLTSTATLTVSPSPTLTKTPTTSTTLTVTQSNSPSPTFTPTVTLTAVVDNLGCATGCPLLFCEDFEGTLPMGLPELAARGWLYSSGGDNFQVINYAPFGSNAIAMSGNPWVGLLHDNPNQIVDVDISVRVETGSAGILIARASNGFEANGFPSQGYLFRAFPGTSNHNDFVLAFNSGAVVIKSVTIPAPLGVSFEMRFSVIGPVLRGYINGVEVLNAVSTTHQNAGNFGIGTFNGAIFDDFRVNPIPYCNPSPTPTPDPLLKLLMSVSPRDAAAGELVTFTLACENQPGGGPANNFELKNLLPEFSKFVSATSDSEVVLVSAPGFGATTGEIIWDVDSLAPGESGQVKLVVQFDENLPAGGTLFREDFNNTSYISNSYVPGPTGSSGFVWTTHPTTIEKYPVLLDPLVSSEQMLALRTSIQQLQGGLPFFSAEMTAAQVFNGTAVLRTQVILPSTNMQDFIIFGGFRMSVDGGFLRLQTGAGTFATNFIFPQNRELIVEAIYNSTTGATVAKVTKKTLLPFETEQDRIVVEGLTVEGSAASNYTLHMINTATNQQFNGYMWVDDIEVCRAIAGEAVLSAKNAPAFKPIVAVGGASVNCPAAPVPVLTPTQVLQSGASIPGNPTIEGTVYAIKEANGIVYVGGNFSRIGEVEVNNFAAILGNEHVNAGSIITTYRPVIANGGLPAVVNAIDVINDVVYFGGDFSTVNGSIRNNLAAIGAVGQPGAAQLLAWNPNLNPSIAYAIIATQSEIFVGGEFQNAGGQARNNLAALDPISGAARPWNPNVQGTVYSLALENQTLYVGGDYSIIDGQLRNNLAAVDTVSAAVLPGFVVNTNDTVRALEIVNGQLYVGGDFAFIGSQARSFLAQVDGSTGLVGPMNLDLNGAVRALSASPDRLYIGGDFTTAQGENRQHLASLQLPSSLLTGWQPAVDQSVNAVLAADTAIYTGGQFVSVNGDAQEKFAGFATDQTAPIATFTSTTTPTFTVTLTATMTHTLTASPSPTVTPTYTRTATMTQSPTSTFTVTLTPSPTITRTYTKTVTRTHSPTSTFTVTLTPSPTATRSYTKTVTRTHTPTATFTITSTFTVTSTYTATPTASPSSTATPTATRTPDIDAPCLDYAIVAEVGNSLHRNNAIVDSYRSSSGAYGGANVFANGNVLAQGQVQVENNAHIQGTTTSGSSLDIAVLPIPAGAIDLGDFEVEHNDVVSLAPGVYRAAKFVVKNNAKLWVDGFRVRIWVTDELIIENNAQVGSATADNLWFFLPQGANTVRFKNNSRTYAAIVAPYTDVILENNAELYGAIVSSNFEIRNNAKLHYDEDLGNDCNFVLPTATPTPAGGGGLLAAFLDSAEHQSLLPADKDLIVAPNPARDWARVYMRVRDSGSARLMLMNLAGEVVMVKPLGSLPRGESSAEIDLDTPASGVYFMSFQMDLGYGYKSMAIFKTAIIK